MLAFIIKVVAALFFAYISIDSFVKTSKIKKDVENELINPKTAKMMRGRAIRSGVIFALAALAAFGTLFIRVAPLGE